MKTKCIHCNEMGNFSGIFKEGLCDYCRFFDALYIHKTNYRLIYKDSILYEEVINNEI
jgi:hypothetical protein